MDALHRVLTASMVQAYIWRSILIAVAASLLLLIGAFGAGYWFHGNQQLVAGVSAGQLRGRLRKRDLRVSRVVSAMTGAAYPPDLSSS